MSALWLALGGVAFAAIATIAVVRRRKGEMTYA
jgi:LPXTG-motif cell wall-anchored protein